MRQAIEDKQMLCYLTALSLTLSVIESSLPHALPFLRLGLANLALLYALERLSTGDYFLLAFFKWLLSSLLSGLLFSPFSLVSLAGNAASAVLMLVLYRTLAGRLISLYSVSALGSAASGICQLAASSLFLSSAVMRLTPLMLVFNLASGLILAFVCCHVKTPENVTIETKAATGKDGGSSLVYLLYFAGFIALLANRSLIMLALSFVIALLLCMKTGRKIRLHFYILSFIFILIFNLLVPSGRVLFSFVTEEALRLGTERALRLCAAVALSQSLAGISMPQAGFIAGVLAVYGQLNDFFFSQSGKLMQKIKATLAVNHFEWEEHEAGKAGTKTAVLPILILILLSSVSFFIT